MSARSGGSGPRNTPPVDAQRGRDSAGEGGAGRQASGSQGQGNGSRGSGGRSGGAQFSRGGSARSEGRVWEKHQRRAEYGEHPFLWDKYNECGKTCLSFGFPPKVKDNRWKEDDRDTGQGRCKFNRDCRVFDGPEHTDPKPDRIRDRINSRGNLVLAPKVENVPLESIHPNYQHHDKPRHEHFQRAPQAPFKGCGGARTPFWSDHVEFNVGHGHGVGPYQQCRGEHGRVPRGQAGKAFEFTARRRAMVQHAFDGIAGRRGAVEAPVAAVTARFQARRVRGVVARQQTEAEATRRMLERLVGEEEGAETVSFAAFEAMYQRESDSISDDGYFALLLSNEWGSA